MIWTHEKAGDKQDGKYTRGESALETSHQLLRWLHAVPRTSMTYFGSPPRTNVDTDVDGSYPPTMLGEWLS